jgi:chemotaxis protein CheZ
MNADEGAGLRQLVSEAVRAEFAGMFEELRRFVDRRIAELSSEVHATVQMVDFSETNLTQQLARMHQQLSRVVALPAAATRNSGSELVGVVQASEDAANRIITAAEKIAAALDDAVPKPVILEQVNAIFEACGFQDLTGQRIRRVLDQLTSLDRMLAHLAEHGHHREEPAIAHDPIRLTVEIEGSGPDLAQNEIDQLMAR